MLSHCLFQFFLNRLGLQLPSLRWMTAEEDQYTVAFKRSEPETVTVKYLLETDPYEYLVYYLSSKLFIPPHSL